ncbi:MAG: DUF4831 family protein [Tannerellaceae bacterium]|jgi:hypothetical protein|nr:DUF4831 family protein [Tannerellaceae bacterium]
MKLLIHTIFCLMLCLTAAAQTKVTKKIAAKATDTGLTYSLPKTTITFRIEIIRTTAKAGPYYRYADKYLGVKNAIEADETSYQLGKIHVSTRGIPDTEQTYLIDFKPGTTSPYAYLTDEGLLCTINAEYEPSAEETPATPVPVPATADPVEEPAPVFLEELLMAGSIAKQAEVAAKQIYRIHESRLNILTGEADNLPPDGEAMKVVIQELERREKALTALFTGSSTKETQYHELTIVPYKDLEREVLFRFSTQRGLVDADDLGGTPVYIRLTAQETPVAPAPNPKDAKKKEDPKGLVYNIPGKAQIQIDINRETLYKGETLVAQFGRRDLLTPALFEDRKKPVRIYFYPETGAIRQIIQ